MKRKIILRGLQGILPGIAIGYLITVAGSQAWGQGHYVPFVPGLIAAVENELEAVRLQTLFWGVLGAGFGAASIIWEMERWSLVRQTGVYFAIVSMIMMPIAYVLHWMEHSMWGFLSYFGIFALIFAAVWAIEFITGKYMVKKLNAHLWGTKGER